MPTLIAGAVGNFNRELVHCLHKQGQYIRKLARNACKLDPKTRKNLQGFEECETHYGFDVLDCVHIEAGVVTSAYSAITEL